MNTSEVAPQAQIFVEPTIEPVELFELPAEKLRREWAAMGADWAWQVLKFLQGRRTNEVSVEEVQRTKTFSRATELEKKSLLFVAHEAQQSRVPTEDDLCVLNERDDFLIAFSEGRVLGRRNWANQILSIPVAVRSREEYDRQFFPVVYKSPSLFGWLCGEPSQTIDRR